MDVTNASVSGCDKLLMSSYLWGQLIVLPWWFGAATGWQMFCIRVIMFFNSLTRPLQSWGQWLQFVQCYSSQSSSRIYLSPPLSNSRAPSKTSWSLAQVDFTYSGKSTARETYIPHTAMSGSHLDVNSLDDTGDDVEHLHFSVALRHLLQQLEEQPEDRLQVLNRGERAEWGKINIYKEILRKIPAKVKNVLTGRNFSVRNSKSSTGGRLS